MRIALVTPYDWCVDGGVKSHIVHLAAFFRKWGHDVTIFAPASDRSKVGDECVVMGKPRSLRVSGSVARITFSWNPDEVKHALAEGRFDVVHLHEPLMPLLPYQFLRFSQAVNVGTFHAAKEGGNRFYSYTAPLARRWFRKLDGKIAVSPAAVNLVSRYFHGYFNVIPNGIDYEHFAAPCEPMPEFMDGKFNLLFVGRPEKRKGLKFLLRAYMRVKEQYPDTRLIVVGAGDFSRWERIMRPIGGVEFRTYVSYEDLPRYQRTADVVCCPNTGNESQGYVVMEALAAGRPVVASNIEGFAGVITDELEGLLVTPKDPEALANAILRLRRNPELRKSLAAHGQIRAQRYRWDTIARQVMSYYERLLFERKEVAELREKKDSRKAVGAGS